MYLFFRSVIHILLFLFLNSFTWLYLLFPFFFSILKENLSSYFSFLYTNFICTPPYTYVDSFLMFLPFSFSLNFILSKIHSFWIFFSFPLIILEFSFLISFHFHWFLFFFFFIFPVLCLIYTVFHFTIHLLIHKLIHRRISTLTL